LQSSALKFLHGGYSYAVLDWHDGVADELCFAAPSVLSGIDSVGGIAAGAAMFGG
jgi:hypothetical protein